MKKYLLLITMIMFSGCAANRSDNQVNSCLPTSTENLSTVEELKSLPSAEAANYQQFIVKFNHSSPGTLIPSGNAVREYRVSGISMKLVADKTYTFEAPQSFDEKTEFLAELAAREDVEYVEPDYPINQTIDEESDLATTATNSLWSHSATHVQQAWNYTQGSQDIVVAVVDSGIDYTHVDLKKNMWRNPSEVVNGRDDDGNGLVDDIHGWNFVANKADMRTTSKSNHGTHVAGTIGATGEGGRGVIGMSPKVKLMGLKFIGETGSGATSNAIKAIDYAIKKKVFAINNSWGSSRYSNALAEAITRAEKAGVLFVVAAGNGGVNIDRSAWYPAGYSNSNILNVASSTSNDKLSDFSNFSRLRVDVAAPGSAILSTVSNQGYAKMSGTSMAAPLVTGLAVLVKSANRNLDYKQVKAVIRSSVDHLSAMNMLITGGRVNALAAVKMAAGASGLNAGAEFCN